MPHGQTKQEFGRRLRMARVAAGFATGRAFAEALGDHEDTVNTWELVSVIRSWPRSGVSRRC